MSYLGRYRRAYPRLFRHPGFKQLPPLGQRLTVYVLFGPQSNRIGLFYFSLQTAAEDLGTTNESLRKAWPDVASTFGWGFDASNHVLFIPSWWRWNHPENENVLRGNLKDLNDVPRCELMERFVTNTGDLDPRFHGTFIEGCTKRLPKGPPDQYQYQDQKQKQVAARAARVTALARPAEKTAEKRSREDGTQTPHPLRETTDPEQHSREEGREAKLHAVATETLKVVSPHLPLDELVEAFFHIARQARVTAGASEARHALNVALSERRAVR